MATSCKWSSHSGYLTRNVYAFLNFPKCLNHLIFHLFTSGKKYELNDTLTSMINSLHNTSLLQHLTNAGYLISSWPIMSKPTLFIPGNFVYIYIYGVTFDRHVLDNTLNTTADNGTVITYQVIHPLSHSFHCWEKSSLFWTEVCTRQNMLYFLPESVSL